MSIATAKLLTAKPAPKRVADQGDKELSGAQWEQRFKGSASTKDLTATFRKAVEAFIDAMTSAGIAVRISNTFRPIPRSYLMHWCWEIAAKNVKAEDVPAMNGVNINWVHPTAEASIAAANKMVKAFEMGNLKTSPALQSLHNVGRAIDMSISWTDTVTVKDADGKLIKLKTTPRTGMNRQLKTVGASYGVKKFIGGHKDKPHWSDNGR